MPVSVLSYPVAGNIEDTATNSLLVLHNTNQITQYLYQVMGFELIHASQAVDLRKMKDEHLTLGSKTALLQSAFRQKVSFVNQDRNFTPDIQNAYTFIENYLSK